MRSKTWLGATRSRVGASQSFEPLLFLWRRPYTTRPVLAKFKQQWVDPLRCHALISQGARLVLHPEVEHALYSRVPIIALESTIITHGMPRPTNLTTAQSLEYILRSRGVVPATIAILRGRVHIGVTQSELEELADTREAVKVSRRDIGAAIASGGIGGTTVAGTMVLAHSVGIQLFITGGIGGVHRGAENSAFLRYGLVRLTE